MGTYFKYAERNIQNDVNWAEIGKNLTDMLQEQNKLREDKKDAIDEASRQFGQVLEKNPIGTDANGNTWSLDYAAKAKETMLMQDRLLKRGLLKVKDYTIMRQNTIDGTTDAYGALSDWQTYSKEKTRRREAKESAFEETFDMGRTEGLGDFTKTALYIDPNTGVVSVGTKKYDAKTNMNIMNPDTSTYSTVSGLRARMAEKINRYKVEERLTDVVKTLGTYITANPSKSGVSNAGTVEDLLNNTAYTTAEDNIINEMLINPHDAGSILTDFVGNDPTGKAYTFTFDKEKVDANHILYIPDPNNAGSGQYVPSLSTEQVTNAKAKIKERLHTMLTHKETAETKQAPQQTPQWKAEGDKEDKIALTAVGNWNKMYYGNAEEKRAGKDAWLASPVARENYIYDIDLSTTGKAVVKFKYADGTTAETEINMDNVSGTEWSNTGAGYAGADNITAQRSGGGENMSKRIYSPSTATGGGMVFSAAPTTTGATPAAKVSAYVGSNIPMQMLNRTESKVVPDLQTWLSPLGFDVEESGVGSYATITNPKTKKSIEIGLNDATTAARELKRLKDFVTNNFDAAEVISAEKMGKFGAPR